MKLKTKSSAKKRFKLTKRGKIRMDKVAHNHLLMQKSKRQKKLARAKRNISKSDVKKIKKMLNR